MKNLAMIAAVVAMLCIFTSPALAGGKEAKKGAEEGPGIHFVELTPLILPIIDGNGASQVISMVVALEVDSAEHVGKVEKMTPRLKDAYLQDMYGVLNKHAALKGGHVQIGFIKKRLNAASNRVLGDGVVQDVLLQVVQQRPI